MTHSTDTSVRQPVLSVRNLEIRFATPDGEVRAANGIDLDIHAGETLGVVGESGSGKSQLFLAVMGLLASNGRVSGSAKLAGEELVGLSARQLDRVRGGQMAMIFQDPMTCLNPYLKVGTQMTEVLRQHKGMDRAGARRRAIEMLDLVRIPEAARRLDMYPHEFSGGMRQRVMIAMALLCDPLLLIADEPTTALDVTVQAQILKILADIKRELGTAIALITHDLGVVAGLCDRVAVMYAGRLIETGPVDAIFKSPGHPYARGLLASTPRLDEKVHDAELPTIAGQPPNLQRLPPGCAFAPRCPHAWERCTDELPLRRAIGAGREMACHLELKQ